MPSPKKNHKMCSWRGPVKNSPLMRVTNTGIDDVIISIFVSHFFLDSYVYMYTYIWLCNMDICKKLNHRICNIYIYVCSIWFHWKHPATIKNPLVAPKETPGFTVRICQVEHRLQVDFFAQRNVQNLLLLTGYHRDTPKKYPHKVYMGLIVKDTTIPYDTWWRNRSDYMPWSKVAKKENGYPTFNRKSLQWVSNPLLLGWWPSSMIWKQREFRPNRTYVHHRSCIKVYKNTLLEGCAINFGQKEYLGKAVGHVLDMRRIFDKAWLTVLVNHPKQILDTILLERIAKHLVLDERWYQPPVVSLQLTELAFEHGHFAQPSYIYTLLYIHILYILYILYSI